MSILHFNSCSSRVYPKRLGNSPLIPVKVTDKAAGVKQWDREPVKSHKSMCVVNTTKLYIKKQKTGIEYLNKPSSHNKVVRKVQSKRFLAA